VDTVLGLPPRHDVGCNGLWDGCSCGISPRGLTQAAEREWPWLRVQAAEEAMWTSTSNRQAGYHMFDEDDGESH
jgi:hypothetical protein